MQKVYAMGKVKSDTPRGRFVFRNGPNPSGERALNIQYVLDSVPVYRSTGIFLHPDNWNAAKQEVRAKCPDATRLNKKLAAFKSKIDSELQACDDIITVEVLRSIVKGDYNNMGKDANFVDFADKYNEMRYENGKLSYSTYYNAQLSIRNFRKFLAEKRIPEPRVSNVTVALIEKYKEYNLNEKHMTSKDAINKKIAPIILASRYASDNGLLDARISTAIGQAYFDINSRQYENEGDHERVVRYLTEEQIQQFRSFYKETTDVRRHRIMDIFLFSYYACGLRVSDLVTLEWSQIDMETRELVKKIVKTKKRLRVPLCDEAREILEKYKKLDKNPRFVFNCLPEDFNLADAAKLDMTLKAKNRNFQTSLRAWGEKMKLPFTLTMHVARHSFAVQALNNGMDVHMISTLLGHSTSSITERVYAQFLDQTLDNAVMEKMPFNFSSKPGCVNDGPVVS